MYNAKRYVYTVFMSQQAFEKCLKAYIIFNGGNIIPIHNLRRLALVAEVLDQMNKCDIEKIDYLSQFYLNARYKEDIEELLIQITPGKAEEYLVFNSMAYAKDEAIRLARSFLKEAAKKHSISYAFIFGSYMKGMQKDYSDIDVAAIMSKDIQKGKYYKETFEIFHEAQEYNPLIEVICFREDEFESDREVVISQIKKEGLRVDF